MNLKKLFVATIVSLSAACSSNNTEIELPDNPSTLPFKDARGSNSGGNLIDHGGKILPVSNVYAIWWGNSVAFPSDAQIGITSLFNGFSNSNYLAVSNQYMRNNTASLNFQTNWTDTSAPPNHNPSSSVIVNEACKMINNNNSSPDSNAIYFVYTSNFPHLSYCGYHSYGSCNGVNIQVAYIPNTSGIGGCDPGNLYNCNSYSQGTRSMANVSAHEFIETITDSSLSAWYDSAGSEIMDKCNFQFDSCVQLNNGNWQLQKIWSNATSSCIQQ